MKQAAAFALAGTFLVILFCTKPTKIANHVGNDQVDSDPNASSQVGEKRGLLFWGKSKYNGKKGDEYCYNVNVGAGILCCGKAYDMKKGFEGSVCYLENDFSCKDLHQAVFMADGEITMEAEMIGKRAFPKIVTGDGFLLDKDPSKGWVKTPYDYTIKNGLQNGIKTELTGNAMTLPDKSFLVSGWDESQVPSDHEIEWAGPSTIGLGGESFAAPAVIMKGGKGAMVYLDDNDEVLHGAGIRTPIDPEAGVNAKTEHIEFCFDYAPAMATDSEVSVGVFRDGDSGEKEVESDNEEKKATEEDSGDEEKEKDGDKKEETEDEAPPPPPPEDDEGDGDKEEEDEGDKEEEKKSEEKKPEEKKPEETSKHEKGKSPAGIKGDPHIKKWDGTQYDFHGGCDLVMLQNPDFNNGQGLHIYIRTRIEHWWSYIESCVVKIGDDTLEIKGGVDDRRYWVNGKEGRRFRASRNLPFTIGGFHGRFRAINSILTHFKLYLPNEQNLVIKSAKNMLRVDMENCNAKDFGTSLGLMGTFEEGAMMARDNHTVIEDPTEFGMEWQVLNTEPQLFHDVVGPQHPQRCTTPTTKTFLRRQEREREARRMLVESISRQEAEGACASANLDEFADCVYDVMATNDADMASAYA